MPVFQQHMEVFEKTTDTNEYTYKLVNDRFSLIEHIRLQGLQACYWLAFMGKNAKEHTKDFGFTMKDNSLNELTRLLSRIRTLQTKINIKSARKSKDQKNKVSRTYEEIIGNIEATLDSIGRLNPYQISLQQLAVYIQMSNKRAEQLKKQSNARRT